VTNVSKKTLTFAPGPRERGTPVTLSPGESGILGPIHYLVVTENPQVQNLSAAQRLLLANAQWAKEFEAENPGFFAKSAAEKQRPHVKICFRSHRL
jgi:hypothetical protein